MSVQPSSSSSTLTEPLLKNGDSQDGQVKKYGATSEGETPSGEDVEPRLTEEEQAIKKDTKPSFTFGEIKWICLGLWTAIFCGSVGSTLITNLQIEIASDFNAGHLSSWLGSSYLLGQTALTPIYGRLSNVIGRRQTMLLAVCLFDIGSILSAIAPSMNFMIGARVVGGSGSGGLFTVSSIIVADLVPLKDRGLYQGLVNVVLTLGTATGSVIGGYLADLFGWRMVFVLQLPLLLLATVLVLVFVHMPASITPPRSDQTTIQKLARIDWWGCLAVIVSVTCLMIGLSLQTSFDRPLSDPLVSSLFVGAAVGAVSFWAIEMWVAKEPVVPMQLLAMRTPGLIILAMFCYTFTLFSRFYILPIYMKSVRHLSSSATGMVLLPSSMSGSVSSLFAGWYMQKTGKYKLFTIIALIFPLISSFCVLQWGEETNVYRLSFEAAMASMGGGAMITTLLTGLIASVSHEMMALAVAASFLFRAIGQLVGVSISFAVLQTVLDQKLRAGIPDPELISKIIHQPAIIPSLPEIYRQVAVNSCLVSVESVFIVVGGLGVIILACAIGMKAYPLKK